MATANQNAAAAEAAAAEVSTNAVADIFQGGEYENGVLVTPGKAAQVATGAKGAAPKKDASAPKKDAAPAAAAEEQDEAEEGTGAPQSERHRSAQDRINKAVRAQRAAERRVAELDARLARLEGGGQQQTRQAPAAATKPDPSKYPLQDLDPQYIADLTEFAARAANAKIKDEDKTAAATKADNDRKAANKVKVDKFIDKGLDAYDDFDVTVVQDNSLPFSQALVEFALDSEFGPQVLYEAATDPKTVKLLSTLTPLRQVAWFGRQEDALSSAGSQDATEEDDESGEPPVRAATKAKASKAPAPIASARGSSGQSGNSATSDFRQFEAMAMGRNR